MKILYLGDIYGEETLNVLERYLPQIRKEENINIIFANAENVTDGKGLSLLHYKRLMAMGIQALSMGNHTFSKSEIKDFINDSNIVIPANINTDMGNKILYVKYNDKKIAIINMLGRVFSNMLLNCPFQTTDNLLELVDADYTIVDFHGDATSEKKAYQYEYSGRVSAILGTHTHIQTADEEVYKNTAYITDIGMCGPKISVIGMNKDFAIERFKTGLYNRGGVATGNLYQINAVILDFEKEIKIKRFNKTYKI